MNSLSLLRFLSVFALILLSAPVANPLEIRNWDAFSLSSSDDDELESSNPGATNIWAQSPDIIDNGPANPVDGNDPSNCFRERTKNLGKRQARPEMCQDNYQMDRKAGQSPAKTNPAIRKPVDSINLLFSSPQKPPTDEEKVCAKAPESAIYPVCAWIEWVVESLAVSFVDLDFCRPCEFFFLNTDNLKRSGNRKERGNPFDIFFWGGGEIYLGYV